MRTAKAKRPSTSSTPGSARAIRRTSACVAMPLSRAEYLSNHSDDELGMVELDVVAAQAVRHHSSSAGELGEIDAHGIAAPIGQREPRRRTGPLGSQDDDQRQIAERMGIALPLIVERSHLF